MRPDPVPIQRLYDICLSCPTKETGWLDWGHSYGGLMNRLPTEGYPWEDVHIAGYIRRYLGVTDSPLSLLIGEPLDIPEIQTALVEAQVKRADYAALPIPPASGDTSDCFQRLPPEVLEVIRDLLPLSDVASARLASRSFTRLPFTQSFWASRFTHAHERGYCLEAMDPQCSSLAVQRTRDWRMLYELTAVTPSSSQQLKNRKRIWSYLKDIVSLLLEQPLPNENMTRELDTSPLVPGESWRSVGGDFIARPANSFPRKLKCRAIYAQTAPIPNLVHSIGVSFQTLGDKQYVSGLRFTAPTGEQTDIGYILPQKEKFYSFHHGPSVVTGFIVAAVPRGITALRTVTSDGDISPWIGSANGLPQTTRLCTKTAIHTIKAHFDGFKLVSLSIPSNLPPLFPPETEAGPLPLRVTALWYPSIPPATQHLYDASFPGRLFPDHEYRPLVRVMFGGLRGDLLPYLTRLEVTVCNAAIVGVDFFYAEDAPVQRVQACPSTASADNSVKIPFAIDGPGGERLTSLHAEGSFNGYAGGVSRAGSCWITSLKVTTNTKPDPFVFQPCALPRIMLPSKPVPRERRKTIEIEPGLTLTGIYFMHDPDFAMVSIGPISENLDQVIPQEGEIEEEVRAQTIGQA
ncbi:hypothetical protein BJX96DRAFT_152163 [Aspergillus floccosus]